MKIPRLIADEEVGEGYLIVPEKWQQIDPLLKADILKDWIYALENMYNSSLIEMKAQYAIRKAMK